MTSSDRLASGLENSFDKCIPIELDTNVEDILMNDGQNVSFVKLRIITWH